MTLKLNSTLQPPQPPLLKKTPVTEKLTRVFVALSGELLELQRQRGPGIRHGPGRESRPQALWEVA